MDSTNGSNGHQAPESAPGNGRGHAGRLEKIAFIGNYLPRVCGIATFTSDVAGSVAAAAADAQNWVLAMNDRPQGYEYPAQVRFEIDQNKLSEYHLAAEYLNIHQVDVVCVQHEFGIYGGASGHYIVQLLRDLRMPVVTTLHTVLRDPNSEQKDVMRRLADVSDRLIVMSHKAVDFLKDIYGVPEEKVRFIPHGIPDVPFLDPSFHKDDFGLEGRKVLLTFGLLSPGKGIENAIDAMPQIVEQHPDAVYVILGATHPHVKAHSGEEYRLGLQRRAEQLGVAGNVVFHNRFVELPELCDFLGAADIYVTPYLNEAQITSGTLAYALGAGKATVSTPYWYAQEMLADERGILVPFNDTGALSDACVWLLDNEVERHAMRKRAYLHCRSMIWTEVAQQYLDVFQEARAEGRRRPVLALALRTVSQKVPELPEVKLDSLRQMTDDTGMLQHAKFTVPDRNHGYCVDDNARALAVVAMAQELLPHDPTLAPLMGTYLSFLDHAFNPENGRFRNFLSYDRTWCEDCGSEDSHGRAAWGLGVAVAYSTTRGHMALAVNLFNRALEALDDMYSPRAVAFGLIGIHAYLRRFSGDSRARRTRDLLADRLFQWFSANATDDWPWFEDVVTYANGRVAQGLLLSGQWMYNQEMIDVGLRAVDWLMAIQTTEGNRFAPIGNDGWYPRGGQPARFAQQPIEASGMVDACVEAYNCTRDPKYIAFAHRCLHWFLGDNDLHTPLYDHTTGGCYDGIHPQHINENQGAESTLAWLLALLAVYQHRRINSADTSTPIVDTLRRAG